jgi:hypothetical protein
MPGVIRRVQRTRCSFCPRQCVYARVVITSRQYGGTWRTIYRLCEDCGQDTLRRLLARPRGSLV